jgi:hypothetical protein
MKGKIIGRGLKRKHYACGRYLSLALILLYLQPPNLGKRAYAVHNSEL